MEYIWGENIFQKCFDKPMERESDFGGLEYFL